MSNNIFNSTSIENLGDIFSDSRCCVRHLHHRIRKKNLEGIPYPVKGVRGCYPSSRGVSLPSDSLRVRLRLYKQQHFSAVLSVSSYNLGTVIDKACDP